MKKITSVQPLSAAAFHALGFALFPLQCSFTVLRLMQEMHTLAKSLMPQGKAEFLAKLCSKGIFRLVGELIMSTSPEVRRLAVDIVSQSCQQEPGVLRGYIVDEESKGRSVLILYNVVLRLVSDSQDSERVEMVEILKQLLETGQKATTQMPERAVVTDPEEMSRLLEIFYDQCMPLAIKQLLREPDAGVSQYFHLLDFLSFCVTQHMDCMKKLIIQHNLIGKVVAFLASSFCTVHLASSVARFLKAIVMTRDDALTKQIVKANAFKVRVLACHTRAHAAALHIHTHLFAPIHTASCKCPKSF